MRKCKPGELRSANMESSWRAAFFHYRQSGARTSHVFQTHAGARNRSSALERPKEDKKQLSGDGRQPPSSAALRGQKQPLAEPQDRAWPLRPCLLGKSSSPSTKGQGIDLGVGCCSPVRFPSWLFHPSPGQIPETIC